MLTVGAVQATAEIKYDNKGFKQFSKDLKTADSAVATSSSKIKDLGKNVSSVSAAGFGKAKDSVKSFGTAMKGAGTQVATAGSKIKSFGKTVGTTAMSGLKKMGTGLKSVGSGLMNVGRMALGGLKSLAKFGAVGAAAVVGVAYALGKLVNMGIEVQKGIEQTQQVIKTTGGAANVTADDIDNLTGRLSNMSGVDDDLIRNGSNMLLTFKNIRNEAGKGNKIFNQATTAALDMSVAMGEDMQSSSIRLGKALNDPIKGVSALSRVGVQFTEQQKAQIEAMVESGKTMEAQKLILGELQSQFGGQAKKQMQPIERLKVNIENLGESIGLSLLPNAEKGANAINKMVVKFMNDFEKGKGFAGDFANFLKKTGDKVVGFLQDMASGKGAGGDFKSKAEETFTWFKEQIAAVQDYFKTGNQQDGFAGFLITIMETMQALLPTLKLLSTVSSGLLKIFNSLDPGTQQLVITMLMLAKAFSIVRSAALAMGVASTLSLGPWGIAIMAVIAAVVLLVTHFEEWKAGMKIIFDWMKKAVNSVKDSLVSAFNWVKEKVIQAFQLIGKAAKMGLLGPLPFLIANWRKIPGVFAAIKDKIVSIFNGIKDFIIGVFKSILGYITSLPGRAWSSIKRIGDMFSKVGNNMLNLFKGIASKFVNFFKPIPGKIFNLFRSAPSFFLKLFSRVGETIANGFKSGLNAIISAWNNLEFSTPEIDPPGPGKFPSITVGTPDIPLLASGGAVKSGNLGIVGDGKKTEWVISQEGDKKQNTEWLLEAASALGINLFAKGGKTKKGRTPAQKGAAKAVAQQAALSNKKSLLERQFSRTGGVVDSSEYNRLIAITSNQIKAAKSESTNLTKRANYLKSILPSVKNKQKAASLRDELSTIRQRLAELKWEIPNLIEDRQQYYSDKKSYATDTAQAENDSRVETPGYDQKLQTLETELALTEIGRGKRTAADINAEIEKVLLGKLGELQTRLSTSKNRDLSNALNQAIASVASQIASMRSGGGSGGGAPSMQYQMAAYDNARFDALKMGSNITNNTREGNKIEIKNIFPAQKKMHTASEELSFQLKNNLS